MADLSRFRDDELEEALRRKRQSSLADIPDDVLERRLAELRRPEPSMLQRVGQAFTGNAAENLPSLYSPEFSAQAKQIRESQGRNDFFNAVKLGSSAYLGDDSDVANAVRREFPDAALEHDANGNPIIRMGDGQRYYVNEPGLDSHDVTRFAGKVAAFAPAARAAGMFGSLGGRMLVGGAGAAATDVAMQAGAGRSEVDPVQTGLAAGGGALAETIMPIFGAGKRFVQDKLLPRETLVRKGKTIAERAGLQQVSDDAAEALARRSDEIAAGTDPRAIIAEQEFGYRLTRGQRTGDEAVLRREELLRSANPNGPLGQLERQNLAQTEQNVQRFREMAARGSTPEAYEQDAAQRLRDGLARSREAAKQQVGGAYGEVPSKAAFASPDDLAALGSRVDDAFINSDTIVGDLTPATLAARQAIEQAMKASGGAPMRMDRLIALRKSLGRMRGSAVKEDEFAFSILSKEFDSWFDEALTRNLMAGDPGAIAPFREANQIASRYFSMFEDRKSEPGKAILRMLTKEATPEQVANVLLNANGINKPGAAAIAKRYIEAVGKDTDGVTALRDIIARRLFEKAGDPKGHQAIVSSLKDALNGRGRSLMSTVFSKTELHMMEKFAKTLDQYFVPKGMLGRSSGTAERLVGMLAPFANLPMAGTLRSIGNAMSERAAMRPLLTSRPAALPAGVAAGVAGSRDDERRRRRR